jgi:transcriptional regulator with XRE-family HTH domain
MNIKELRTKEGLSQSALAKKLGIATSAIGHMENGRMKVSAKIAAKVKEEFGVDIADAVTAEKIEVKKTAAKASRKAKETVKEVENKVEKKVKDSKAKAAKLEIIVQSPMGGNITAEEIAAKVPAGAESVFFRVDQNKLWWIKGEETGSVDIW